MDPSTDNEFEIPISQNTFAHLDNDDDDDDVIELPPANSDEVVSPPDDIVGPPIRSAKPLGNVWSKKKKIAVGLAAAATFVAAISIGIVYGKNRSSAANNGVVSASMMTLDKCLELDKYSEYRAYAFEGTPTPTPTTYEPTTYEPTESEDTPAASDDVFPIQYDDQLYLSNDGNGGRKLVTGHEKSLRLSKSMKEDKIGRGVNPASRGRRLVCDDIVYEAYGTSSKSTKSSTKSSKSTRCGSTKSAKATCEPTSQPTSAPTCANRTVKITTEKQAITSRINGRQRRFSIRVREEADSDVTLRVFTRGDIERDNEFYSIRTEIDPNTPLGKTGSSSSQTCDRSDPYISDEYTLVKDDFNAEVQDGFFGVQATANKSVSPCRCSIFGCRDSVYVELQYTVCAASPPPPTPGPNPSCMSGDTRVSSGNHGADEIQDYRYVRDLTIGDSIKGLDENQDPTTCFVKAKGYFGRGKVFGNYTDHHYVLEDSSNDVKINGQNGDPQVVDKFAVLTSCPAGLDESGIGFSAIDSDFTGNDDPISWSDYVLVHKGILNLVEEVGPSVFSPSAYISMETVKKYTQQFYKTMLTCIKDSSNCDSFERASQELIDNSLTDETKEKVMSIFSNLGVSTQSGSIAAVMSKGESVRA